MRGDCLTRQWMFVLSSSQVSNIFKETNNFCVILGWEKVTLIRWRYMSSLTVNIRVNCKGVHKRLGFSAVWASMLK